MADIKRHVAYKIRIKDLLEGEYVKQEGEWGPSFVKCGDLEVARTNIVAAVVAKSDGPNQGAIIDDGTGKINLRTFDDNLDSIAVGGFVLVVGRPREYDGERYLVPEIVKNITDTGWVELRKFELVSLSGGHDVKQNVIDEKPTESGVVNQEEIGVDQEKVEDKDVKPALTDIYEYIKKNDVGDGVEIQQIVDAGIKNAEEIVVGLLEKGEVFEVKPGKVKVLE